MEILQLVINRSHKEDHASICENCFANYVEPYIQDST